MRHQIQDVVHILTPHYLHAPMAFDAVGAGMHVFAEKPMSIAVDEARAMIAVVKRNHVTMDVICQNRYNAASLAIKEALTDCSLGKFISQRILLPWTKLSKFCKRSEWYTARYHRESSYQDSGDELCHLSVCQ
jgi:UDP-N-acetyl-2-amino-2-deoxyglucuronate dehydrogenase